MDFVIQAERSEFRKAEPCGAPVKLGVHVPL
jgi:hypothetical protein